MGPLEASTTEEHRTLDHSSKLERRDSHHALGHDDAGGEQDPRIGRKQLRIGLAPRHGGNRGVATGANRPLQKQRLNAMGTAVLELLLLPLPSGLVPQHDRAPPERCAQTRLSVAASATASVKPNTS